MASWRPMRILLHPFTRSLARSLARSFVASLVAPRSHWFVRRYSYVLFVRSFILSFVASLVAPRSRVALCRSFVASLRNVARLAPESVSSLFGVLVQSRV
jgi:hypothetical protein